MSLDFASSVEIALPSDTPLFTVRVQLDGTDFLLGFNYTEREDRFYLTVNDSTGSPIVGGLKVVENWPLLSRTSDSRRPLGDLFALDTIGEGPPGLHDLGPGRRVSFLYVPLLPVST